MSDIIDIATGSEIDPREEDAKARKNRENLVAILEEVIEDIKLGEIDEIFVFTGNLQDRLTCIHAGPPCNPFAMSKQLEYRHKEYDLLYCAPLLYPDTDIED